MKKTPRPRHEPDDSVSLTPMIDVTFLLLLFFLLTLRFRTLEGRLSALLPRDAGTAAYQPEHREDLRIDLFVVDPGLRVDRRTGRPLEPGERLPHELLGRRVGYRLVGSTVPDLERLAARLKGIPASPAPPVVIRPHAGILYGDVVALVDLLVAEGFQDLRFAAP